MLFPMLLLHPAWTGTKVGLVRINLLAGLRFVLVVLTDTAGMVGPYGVYSWGLSVIVLLVIIVQVSQTDC